MGIGLIVNNMNIVAVLNRLLNLANHNVIYEHLALIEDKSEAPRRVFAGNGRLQHVSVFNEGRFLFVFNAGHDDLPLDK